MYICTYLMINVESIATRMSSLIKFRIYKWFTDILILRVNRFGTNKPECVRYHCLWRLLTKRFGRIISSLRSLPNDVMIKNKKNEKFPSRKDSPLYSLILRRIRFERKTYIFLIYFLMGNKTPVPVSLNGVLNIFKSLITKIKRYYSLLKKENCVFLSNGKI